MSRDLNRANFSEMRRELRIDWEKEIAGLNAEGILGVIKARVKTAMENHIPLRRKRNAGKPKWMTGEILSLIGKKRNTWRRWKVCASEENKSRYVALEKTVKKKIRNSKNGVERRIAKEAKENPRAFYSYVNSSKRVRVKIGPLIDEDGGVVVNPQDQAEIFNAYYATVFTRSVVEPQPVDDPLTTALEDVEISTERVMNTIDGLKAKSASGPDGIGNQVLKELKEQLSYPLSILFRKSLDEGVVPKDWKESSITPIFKKGQRSEPGNYRLVNLTSNTCKLMEKIIKVPL